MGHESHGECRGPCRPLPEGRPAGHQSTTQMPLTFPGPYHGNRKGRFRMRERDHAHEDRVHALLPRHVVRRLDPGRRRVAGIGQRPDSTEHSFGLKILEKKVAPVPRHLERLRAKRSAQFVLGAWRRVHGAINPPVFSVPPKVVIGIRARHFSGLGASWFAGNGSHEKFNGPRRAGHVRATRRSAGSGTVPPVS